MAPVAVLGLGRGADDPVARDSAAMERLSGMDASFLYLESPTQPMHVTLCAVLDPAAAPADSPWTIAAARDLIASRVHQIAPFHRRVVDVPLRLAHPLWMEHVDVDIDAHVHHAALPAPGDDAALAEFVARTAAIPLDRSRPLWEVWLLEGLEGGKVALVAKVHHAALDGVAGVEQLVTLFDLEPTPRPAETAPHHQSDAEPTDAELVTYAALSRAKSLVEAVPLLGRTASSLFAVRSRRRTDDDPLASDELNADGRPAQAGTPLACPPTPFNGTITSGRRVAFARVALDDVKAVRAASGATVNDVVLAVCTGAVRQYLLDHDALPDEPLVAACPVNVRTADQAGDGHVGNRVSAMFALLHTELSDPADRLTAAKATAAAAKAEHALFAADTLQAWAEVADPNLFAWLADLYTSSGLAGRHRPAINLMISNVPGPPFPLYFAGARLERAYPMGQILDGIGLNITVMSYCDSVDVGLMAASDLVPDVDALAALVPVALAELHTAVVAPPPDPAAEPATETPPSGATTGRRDRKDGARRPAPWWLSGQP